MPVNPTTGIDYDVDRFAVYQVSSSQYVNLNAQWPRPDGGPLVGANPDFRYFKKVNGTPPGIDHRFTLTTTWASVNASPAAPEGHPYGTYEQSFVVTKLPVADLKAQVETEFQRQVALVIPATAVPSKLAATLDAVVRKQDGAVLTNKQQGKRTQAKSIGDQLTVLETRRDELLAAIDADEDYDITEGWGA